MDQELITLQEHLQVRLRVLVGFILPSLQFFVQLFCRSQTLSFFLWQLCCLSFCDFLLQFTHLVFSKFSYHRTFNQCNMMDAISCTGTVYPCGASELTTRLVGFVLLSFQYYVKYSVNPLFVYLFLFFCSFCQYTASGYFLITCFHHMQFRVNAWAR